MSLRFTVPGEPHAWERARQQGRRRFNSSEMTAAKKTIAQYADLAIREARESSSYPKVGNFVMSCQFFLGSTRSSDPDLDNLLKLVMDALNGVAWRDDRQVIVAAATKIRVISGARTEIHLKHHRERE